jgi:hypothetical protein
MAPTGQAGMKPLGVGEAVIGVAASPVIAGAVLTRFPERRLA